MLNSRRLLGTLATLLGLTVLPAAAQAYDYGPANGTNTQVTTNAGLQITAAVTANTTIEVGADGPAARGAVATNFTPNIDPAVISFRPRVLVAGCAAVAGNASAVCTGRGTLTFTFERPVRNPVLHIAGLGGNEGNGVISTQLTLNAGASSAGIALGTVQAGATNLTQTGNVIRVTNDSANATCATAGTRAATAGCGSIPVTGTVTTIAFDTAIRIINTGGTTYTPNTGADLFALNFTAAQDYGDAPAGYEGADAARNDLTDLVLGTTVDEEQAATANATASPNSVAAAASPNSPAGDGADEDAFPTGLPFLTTAQAGGTYSLTVPIAGASAAPTVCGWIDFNRNTTFDATERACSTGLTAGATSAPLTFNVPTATAAGPLYVRLRAGYDATQTQAAAGASDSGETEDYMTVMMPTIRVNKSQSGGAGDTFDLRINGGVEATAVGNGGTTGTQSVYSSTAFGTADLTVAQDVTTAPIPMTFAETASGGNQYAFTSTYACTNATGATVASGSGISGSLNIPQSSGTNAQAQTITCTFTNTQVPPSISIDKTASAVNDVDGNGVDAGDQITFTFSVTNTGGAPLSSITISDPTIVPAITITCPGGTLALGATVTCTTSGPYTLTQANVNAGALNNTATVSGTPPTGPAVTANDSTSTALAAAPSVQLTKTAGAVNDLDSNGPDAGDTITYSFAIQNTGNVTLTGATLNDPLLGGALSCPAGASIAPGQTVNCPTATYTLLQADINAGSRANTATAAATPPTGPAVSDTDSTTTALPQTPAVTVDKVAGALNDVDSNGPDAGDTITYTFTVQNTGNVPLTGVAVNDPVVGTVTCASTTLAVGASTSCTAPTYTLTQADVNSGARNNTATVSATPPSGPAVTGSDSTSTTITRTPTISLTKSAGAINDLDSNGPDAGDTIAYTLTVQNTGNVTLTGVTISDALLGGTITCPAAATLAPGQTVNCPAVTYTLSQADVDAGSRPNTANVSATPPSGPAVTDTDTITTTVPRTSSLTVDKVAGAINDLDSNGPDAGDTIAYTFTVQNTGNTTLTSVGVNDPVVGTVTCTPTVLAPGATSSCTAAAYVLTQADVNSGARNNTATASATPPSGPAITGTDSTSTAIARTPSLQLTKTAGAINDLDSNGPDAGDTITYSFAIQNTGNVTLTGATLNDPLLGGALTCPAGASIAPGQTVNCPTATYTLLQADIDASGRANTATASATPPSGPAVSDTDSTNTAITQTPAVSVDKVAGAINDLDSNGDDAGDTITYTFTVQNTGNVPLTGIAVSDPLLGTVTCASTTLAVGASTSCTAPTYTLTQADVNSGARNNTATVSATPPSGPAVTGTDSTSTAILRSAAIQLTKTAGAINDLDSNGPDAGDTIAYTLAVQNTGNVTLTGVTVNDPLLGGAITCPAASTLAPGQTVSCPAVTYTLTQADVNGGARSNSATASGTPPAGAPVSDGDALVTPIPRTNSLTVDKVAGAINDLDSNGPDAGDTIAYTFTVQNTGNTTLTSVGVNDPTVGTVTCPATTLAPGASTTCTAAPYVLTQGNLDAGAFNNTATASGTPPTGPAVTGTDSTSTALTAAPAITVAKTAGAINDLDSNGPDPGDTIAYTFLVQNTGNVTLTSVSVNDPLVGTVSCPSTTLAPGATTTCTAAPYVLTNGNVDAGSVTNTATASGTPPTGPAVTGTDSETSTIPRTPALTLDKIAGAINDVDSNGPDAGDTITYSFTVQNTGNVTISGLAITDPKVGTVTCPVTTVLAGGTVACTAAPYVLTQGDVDGGSVANTASLSGTSPTGSTVTATDSTSTPIAAGPSITVNKSASAVNDLDSNGNDAGDTITYGFSVQNTGNTTLTSVAVNDPLVGAVTCPQTTLAPGASMTCTSITYTLTQADLNAGSRNNTATASGTTPSSTTVQGTSSVTRALTQNPAVTFDKTAGAVNDVDSNGLDVGDTITYSFAVQNTGNVTLTGVAINDPVVGVVTCPQTTLQPGQSTTCTAPAYVLTQVDLDAGARNNTATLTANPPTGPALTRTDGTSTTLNGALQVAVVKTAGAINDLDSNGPDAGDTIAYSFAVTNSGTVTLTSLAISDPLVGTVTCPVTTLAPGASTTCTAAPYPLTQANVDAGTVVNNATASAQSPTGSPVSATGQATTAVPRTPSLTLDKVAGPLTDPDTNGVDLGDTITYTFTVQNTGNVTLTALAVTDAKVGTVTCPVASLAPGASTTCTAAPYALTQADLDAGVANNTATASVQDPTGATRSASDTTSTPAAATSSLTLDKVAGSVVDLDGNGPDAGDRIDYTFTVQNTGRVTLLSAVITDPLLGPVTCPSAAGLAPGATTTCATVPYTLTQADFDAGVRNNTATVTGTPTSGTPTTATDTTSSALPQNASLKLTVTIDPVQDANGNGPDTNDTVTFRYTVTNTGNVTASGVVVQDPEFGTIQCTPSTLAPGQTATCTAQTRQLTQSEVTSGIVPKDATAQGTAAGGQTLQSADRQQVPVAGTPRFSIRKTANKSTVTAGQTVRFTIAVRNTGTAIARDVTICDRLPKHTTLIGKPKASLRGGVLCWRGKTLAVNERRTFTVTLRVARSAPAGRITNTASIFTGSISAKSRVSVRVKPAPVVQIKRTLVTG